MSNLHELGGMAPPEAAIIGRGARIAAAAREAGALALIGLALGATGQAQAGTVDGISDQRMEAWTPSSEALVGPENLNLKYARRVVHWKTMDRPDDLAKVEAWLAAVSRMGLKPLISFGFPNPTVDRTMPTLKAYRQAVGAFVNTHPGVLEYTAFNEPSHYSDIISPNRAARMYIELAKLCVGKCTVAAADINLIPINTWYIKQYRKVLRRNNVRPSIWAIHPFEGPVSPEDTIKYELPKNARVWLTESALLAGDSQKRDARRLLCIPAERTYTYQLEDVDKENKPGSWDSALVDENGSPRLAYYTLRNDVQKRGNQTSTRSINTKTQQRRTKAPNRLSQTCPPSPYTR